MDDHAIPPSTPCLLVRSCEAGRLQRQLLARAYQQVCPEIRKTIYDRKAATTSSEHAAGSSTAARVAAGA